MRVLALLAASLGLVNAVKTPQEIRAAQAEAYETYRETIKARLLASPTPAGGVKNITFTNPLASRALDCRHSFTGDLLARNRVLR